LGAIEFIGEVAGRSGSSGDFGTSRCSTVKNKEIIVAAFMSSYSSQTYALLRIVSGFLFAIHGGQKVLSFPIEASPGMPWFVTYIA